MTELIWNKCGHPDTKARCVTCLELRVKELEEAPLNLPGAVEAKKAVERVKVLEIQVRRLRDMLNKIRGVAFQRAYGPGDHALEGEILRIIEGPTEDDEIVTEKREERSPWAPNLDFPGNPVVSEKRVEEPPIQTGGFTSCLFCKIPAPLHGPCPKCGR